MHEANLNEKESMKNILNYIQINEQISTAGQPTKEQFKIVSKEGFDVVINLAMHNKGALKKEDKVVSKNGMLYFHLPITWKNPELDRLELFIKLLEMLEKENKKVFIHCIMNYRASVFIHVYKRCIWREEGAFIAPEGYTPNKVWKGILMSYKKRKK